VQVLNRSRSQARRNTHPTVKPLKLMRWIVRLVCPSGGVVLDPFAGSGSTGAAAVLEQRQFVGVERDSDYVTIGRGCPVARRT
jgi:site-specific DNA-methyltransferase (adenine-specific)